MIRTQRSLWFYTLSNRGIIWKGSKISIYSHHITDFNVAGMRYWDGALVLDELKVGINLTMIVEENNPNDPDAVALYWKDAKIGYIPQDSNWLPALLLRFGHNDVLECRILKVDKEADAWKQLRVGIYVTDKSNC
mgnify:CR=1 FL=1